MEEEVAGGASGKLKAPSAGVQKYRANARLLTKAAPWESNHDFGLLKDFIVSRVDKTTTDSTAESLRVRESSTAPPYKKCFYAGSLRCFETLRVS